MLIIHNYPVITSAYLYKIKNFLSERPTILGVQCDYYKVAKNNSSILKNISYSDLKPLSVLHMIYLSFQLMPMIFIFPQIILGTPSLLVSLFKYIFSLTYEKKKAKSLVILDFKTENPNQSIIETFYYSIIGFLSLANTVLKTKYKYKQIYCENLTSLLLACIYKKKFGAKITFYSSKISWKNSDAPNFFYKIEKKLYKYVDCFFEESIETSKCKNLIVYFIHPAACQSSIDYIEALNNTPKLSSFNLNLFCFRRRFSGYSPKLNIDNFKAITFHSTVNVDPHYFKCMNKIFETNLASIKSKKIVIKQDELFEINTIIKSLALYKIDYLLSCVAKKDLDKIYPPNLLPKLKKYSVLTGYISDKLRTYKPSKIDSREFDIVYRGSKLPYHLGKMAQKKYEIGIKFQEFCKQHELKFDISCSIKDRVLGSDWLKFLSSSRAVLAVPSGGLVDLEGKIKQKVAIYLQKHPNSTFEQIYKALFSEYEKSFLIATISPRHFEAIAARTVLIMPYGSSYYAGIFKPNIHYLEIDPEFKNLEKILPKLKDLNFCKFLTTNAYRDILMNDKYHFNKISKMIQKLALQS